MHPNARGASDLPNIMEHLSLMHTADYKEKRGGEFGGGEEKTMKMMMIRRRRRRRRRRRENDCRRNRHNCHRLSHVWVIIGKGGRKTDLLFRVCERGRELKRETHGPNRHEYHRDGTITTSTKHAYSDA